MAFDTDVSRILAKTYFGPRGVRELGDVLKIPQVRCYRRVEDLERIGLLKVKGSSKRNRTYSSNMEHMSLVINDDSMVLTTSSWTGASAIST